MQEENINLNSDKTTPNKKTSGVGPLIGSIVIVILLLIAGLYYWGYISHKQEQKKDLAELEQDISNLENDFAEFENELNFEIESDF